MQVADLVADVRARLGEDIEDFWKDADILRKLNDANRKFANAHPWNWLYTVHTSVPVAAGNAEVELIDDVNLNRHFGLLLVPTQDTSDFRAVAPKRVATYRGLQMRQTFYTRNIPRYFYLVRVVQNFYPDDVTPTDVAPALVVRLLPVPSDDYLAEFHFYRNPPKLVDQTDEPDCPEQYQPAVVAWATGLLWQKELGADAGKAAEQFGIYQSVLRDALRDQTRMGEDESLVWGGEEPELHEEGWLNPLLQIPPELGP